jgi:hypothetical protein
MSENIRTLIIRAAQREGLDPRLALAVAQQESSLRPEVVGDGGKSLGLFQLQPGAAIDAGIDPATRGELINNIAGGVRYLKLKLDQSRGNVPEALSRYNRGTPTYQGRGDPTYVQSVTRQMQEPGLLGRISALVSPRSAAAAELPPAAAPPLRNVSKDLLGVLDEAPAPVPAPASEQPVPSSTSALRNVSTDLVRILNDDMAARTTTPTQLIADVYASDAAPDLQADAERLITHEAAVRQRGGYPEAQPTSAANNPEDIGPMLTDVGRTVAATGTGMAGGAGGAFLGGLTSPVTGPVGPLVGGMAGNYGARRLNVALGLEDEGTLGDVLSVAVPGVTGTVQALAKPIIKRLPGAAGALHQQAAEDLAARAPVPPGGTLPAAQQQVERLAPTGQAATTAQQALESLTPTRQAAKATQQTLEGLRAPAGSGGTQLETALTELQPAVSSAALYTPLHADVTPIRPSNVMQTARAIVRSEGRLAKPFQENKLLAAATGMTDLIRSNNGAIPLNDLLAHQQRLGLMVGEAASKGWPEEAGLRRLYKAVYDDIDHAASQGIPGATQLREAARTYNREQALGDMRRMLEPGRPGVSTSPTGAAQLPRGTRLEQAFERKLSDDPLFAQAFSATERQQLRQVFRNVRSADAIDGFLERLQAGKPGMATDATTGRTTIETVAPLREALERDLVDNPDLAAAIPPPTLTAVRRRMGEAQADETTGRFLERLEPGKPGMATDPVTGRTTIAHAQPLREALERDLVDNPDIATAVPGQVLQGIRRRLAVVEQDETVARFLRRLEPGQPGVSLDPTTGEAALTNVRPLSVAFEREVTSNPTFAKALGPQRIAATRKAFTHAEQEHVQGQLATMLRPGGPGLTIRPDGLVQLHAGQIRKTFEQMLANDATFAAGIPAEQRTAIRRLLSDIEKIPRMPPPGGQHYGSGRNVLKTALAVTGAASLGLGPVGTGLASAAVLGVPQLISRALMTERGRKALLWTLARDGGLWPDALVGAGGAAVRSLTEEELPVTAPPK